MSSLRAFWRNLFHKSRIEADLDDELRVAVEILAAEKADQGMELTEARRQARMELGGIEQVKERVREVRMGAVLEMIGRDLQQAFRGFRRNPGYFGVAAATLALGIGANTAMFTIVDTVFIK